MVFMSGLLILGTRQPVLFLSDRDELALMLKPDLAAPLAYALIIQGDTLINRNI
jgi:hypothetical protein